MAECCFCEHEMLDDNTTTCPANQLVDCHTSIGVITFDTLPYNGAPRCPDCHITQHGTHHPGCECETCPACGGQLISCGCLVEGE